MASLFRPTLAIGRRGIANGRHNIRTFCATTDASTPDEKNTGDVSVDIPIVEPQEKVTKFGSSSPWAVFDSWGAEDIRSDGSIDMNLLSDESVALPFTSTESEPPPVSDILDAFESQMQNRSNSHFGYPYNLMHKNEELHKFMRYSINNLGDPFIPSNYGVHSRQFELVTAPL